MNDKDPNLSHPAVVQHLQDCEALAATSLFDTEAISAADDACARSWEAIPVAVLEQSRPAIEQAVYRVMQRGFQERRRKMEAH